MARTKEPEKIYRTTVHMVLAIKDRRRVMEDAVIKAAIVSALLEATKEENYKLLRIEFGIRNPEGYIEYRHGVIHLLVESQGGTAPDVVLEKLRKTAWGVIKDHIPDISAYSNFTRDYYIADEAHYSQREAYEFVRRRSWRTKRNMNAEENREQIQ